MTTTHYHWNPITDDVLYEQNENAVATAVYTQKPEHFGEVLSQRRADQTSYYHFDAQGSTRRLTDESENVVETATYSAFGEVVEKTTSINSPYGYKGAFGYYTSPQTNDCYVRARHYSPSLGRWLSLDPVGLFASDINLFRYCKNAPLDFADPSGLWELRCRFLSGRVVVTLQRHCWIECDGHSYSLLNNNGTATIIRDDPRDLGKGVIVDSGPNECGCISDQFLNNSTPFPYDQNQCNSNYFANSILRCCGIRLRRPPLAWAWDVCPRQAVGSVYCSCPDHLPTDLIIV